MTVFGVMILGKQIGLKELSIPVFTAVIGYITN
jgi:hypothetical protein